MAYWKKKPALELDLVLFLIFFFTKLFKHRKAEEENMNTLDP